MFADFDHPVISAFISIGTPALLVVGITLALESLPKMIQRQRRAPRR